MKNLGLEPTTASLISFSNTAASTGKDIMQFVEAVADAATGEFERLKEFGIKASVSGEQVAFTFKGVSTSIKNDADSITKYLENIGNTDFAGAATAQMETLNGISSNLKVSINNLYNAMGETGGSELAASSMKTLTKVFNNLETAIKLSNDQVDSTGEAFDGVVSLFNTTAGVVNDIGNAFSGLAEKIGLVYAILALSLIHI